MKDSQFQRGGQIAATALALCCLVPLGAALLGAGGLRALLVRPEALLIGALGVVPGLYFLLRRGFLPRRVFLLRRDGR